MAEYTEEFKELAVSKSNEEGVVISELALELGITPNQLYNWRYEARKNGSLPEKVEAVDEWDGGPDTDYLVADLRTQIADLLDERNALLSRLEGEDAHGGTVAALRRECDEWESRYDALNQAYGDLLEENGDLYNELREAEERVAKGDLMVHSLSKEVKLIRDTLHGLVWALGRGMSVVD